MRSPIFRMRDLERVAIVAAVGVLAMSFWQRLSLTPVSRGLSAAEARLLSGQTGRPLVFPGSYSDTIIVFLDYRCPYCAALYPDVVRPESRVGIVVRHALADQGSRSAQAAVAAECARQEGKFHAFSYALFARRDSIGVISWERFAAAAGVPDLPRFSLCIDKRATMELVDEDMQLARRLDLPGTPVAIHRGRMYVGPVGLGELMREINR